MERKRLRRDDQTEHVIEEIRATVNNHLDRAPIGEARLLAEAAGVSPTTLSHFKDGKYPGDNLAVARKLHHGVQERRALGALRRPGIYQDCWLVATSDGIRLVRRKSKLDAILRNGGGRVVQVFRGPDELFFLEATG